MKLVPVKETNRSFFLKNVTEEQMGKRTSEFLYKDTCMSFPWRKTSFKFAKVSDITFTWLK